jgi:hypothetical protein
MTPLVWSGLLCVALSAGCKRSEQQQDDRSDTVGKDATAKGEAKIDADITGQPNTPAAKPEVPAGSQPQQNTMTLVVEEQSARAVSDKQLEQLVEQAQSATKAITTAITALDGNNVDDAKTALREADDSLTKLANQRPTIDVTVALYDQHEQLDSAQMQAPIDTIPVLATVTRTDFPVYSRAELMARQRERQGQQPDQISATDRANDLALVGTSLVYLEVDMPISATKIEVDQAQRLLDAGKTEEAKALLKHAVASFDVLGMIVAAPEYRVRSLIWSAERAFVSGDMQAAAQQLQQASEALQPFANNAADPQAQAMAQRLLDEIQPLRDNLQSGNVDHQTALAKLSRDAASFSHRMTLLAMMSRNQADDRRELADALMWLEMAATAGVGGAGEQAMTTDIDRALKALEQAKQQAPEAAAADIADIHNRVAQIAELARSQTRDPQQLMTELRAAMFELHNLMLASSVSPAGAGGGQGGQGDPVDTQTGGATPTPPPT